jgi:hypothetical protein
MPKTTHPQSQEQKATIALVASNDGLSKLQRRYLKALEHEKGHITNASILAKVSKRNHARWYKRSPEFAKRVDEIMDLKIEDAEATVDYFTHAIKEQPQLALKAAIYTLDNQGQKKGWGKAQGAAVQTNVAVGLQVGGAIGELIRIQQDYDKKRKEAKDATAESPP